MIKIIQDYFRRTSMIEKLPVRINYTGTEEVGIARFDRPIEERNEETVANLFFTRKQLKAIRKVLLPDESPLEVRVKHHSKDYKWCDEWTSHCEIEILLKLELGAELRLYQGISYVHRRDCNYSSFELKKEEKQEK